MNMGEMLRRTVSRVPDKTALILDDNSLTYDQLNRRVNRLAHGLMALGLKKADRVAVLTHNGIEFYEIYLALCKAGAVTVPFNNLLRERELTRDMGYIHPRFLIYADELSDMVAQVLPHVASVEQAVCVGGCSLPGHHPYDQIMEGQSEDEPDVEVNDEDLMSIFLTSGTTGKPKGAMRTHRHNCLNAMAGAVEMGLMPEDRVLLLFPFFHVTFEDRFCHLMRGNTVVIRREGSFKAPEVLELLTQHRITVCQFVPTMINTMLQEKDIESYDLSSLRLILYAAAPMPVELLKKALQRFKCGFMQFYGQTETGPMTTVLRPEDHRLETDQDLERLSSCGPLGAVVRGAPGGRHGPGGAGGPGGRAHRALRGHDQGLLGAAPGDRQAPGGGGWLHTGDFARRDEAGYVYIVDRKNDMIISGGKNIYPREVEEVLYAHPAVLEASVVGVPDPHWGESVKAVVVVKPQVKASAEELIAHCKENLASYKKPRTIEFREALPKSATGKILKRVLRDEYWQDQDRKV